MKPVVTTTPGRTTKPEATSTARQTTKTVTTTTLRPTTKPVATTTPGPRRTTKPVVTTTARRTTKSVFTTTPRRTTKSVVTTTVGLREIKTFGGSANGDICHFPFQLNGEYMYSCQTSGQNYPWCGTTLMYDEDLKWGYCLDEVMPTFGGETGNETCSFPFFWNKTLHYQCIPSEFGDVKMCSTTPDYDRDGKMAYCLDDKQKVRGGSDPNGVCVFPFFSNKVYTECIPTSSRDTTGRSWCSTAPDRVYSSSYWGYCKPDVTLTMGGNDPNGSCVFPFYADGEVHSTCITTKYRQKPWCSTTHNYHLNHTWTYCMEPLEIGTFGGTGNNRNCSFPFFYKGELYDKCINDTATSDWLWCSVTPDYDVDQAWGYCNVMDIKTFGSSSNKAKDEGKSCHFPFKMNDKMYSRCLPSDLPGVNMCSLTADYDKDKSKAYCLDDVTMTYNGNSNGSSCAFPFVYTGKVYAECIPQSRGSPWCSTTHDYDSDGIWGECVPPDNQLTKGGNGAGKPCQFPFLDKDGSVQRKCLTTKSKQWCATTHNYKLDRQWTYCVNGTFVIEGFGNAYPGATCEFPFIYKGKEYNECIKSKSGTWCSLTADFDADKQWGYCQRKTENLQDDLDDLGLRAAQSTSLGQNELNFRIFVMSKNVVQ
ncbi:uncharacterized protein LOC141915470 [Tubulanus polymorphus]|uniref:uncharacterized protein LOC141915470 n=1 Tax=Tubulanus polymorphus TaxID=672921 RepID=UPI003DA35768